LSNSKKGKIYKSFESSFFINVLIKISDFFYSKIRTSRLAQLFTSYDNMTDSYSDSFAGETVNKIKPRSKTVLGLKNSISSRVENSFFYGLINKVIDFLLGAKLKFYGVILFILGFFATGTELIKTFLENAELSTISDLPWQGIAFILISIPLLLSKEQLCTALLSSGISKRIIGFIGYKNKDVMRTAVGDTTALPVLIGVFLGVLAIFIPPVIFVAALFGFVYLALTFNKPEFNVILTIATLPFLPTMVICGELILTLIAFLFKAIRGKRSIRFELLDLFVLAFAILMIFGGLFSVSPSESLPPASVFFCFMLSYFLIVNLIKTKELLKKLISFSLVSFTICSLYGIYQNFFEAPDTTWTDEDMFSAIETRVVSTFENPNVFGEYLIMLIPLALTFMLLAKKMSGKSLSLVSLVASVAALIFTWSRGAWLGCIVSLLIFFIILNKNSLGAYIMGMLAFPLAIPFLPESIVSRFTSIGNMTDSSTSYRVYIWEASLGMIKDFPLTGIGIGTGAYQAVYSEYALAGIETAPHSHNLYMQIMIELGILGFAVFMLTMFLFVNKAFTFIKSTSFSDARLLVGAVTCGIVAILVQGLTDYVWYNYRVFAFFWMMIGIASTAINIYKSDEIPENNIM